MNIVITSILVLVVGIIFGIVITKLLLSKGVDNAKRLLKEELREEYQLELEVKARDIIAKDLEIARMSTQLELVSSSESTRKKTESDRVVLLEENIFLKTKLEESERNASEKLTLLQEARDSMKKDFEVLANRIFEDRSSKFREVNQESLTNLLNPVKIQIEDFRKRIESVYDNENRDRASLKTEILSLQKLNATLNQEAVNLTRALKGDPKKQGNWGEMKLERILEESQLKKGLEYLTQAYYKDEEGKRNYPDVVIKLPESKDIVIDAKMSLVAYERFVSEENPKERENSLKAHILSVRQHVKELAAKRYDTLKGINTISHVLMFIPIESAYLLALEKDNQLFLDAMNKNIMIVGPSTLMYVLRTIKQIWKSEYQTLNVIKIAEEGGKMYDKFVGFVDNMEKIDANITALTKTYNSAMTQLKTGSGNLVKRAHDLRKLGINTKKELTIREEELENS
ncbi:MAG: hypothetical protein B6226_00140 [Candidatus Cloacimonetes bacterium 4572_65]|nr:MAG: hypothetical protein B6226_00140 [Candidatus Cloacimonetes bacterium 4572_65]